MKTPFLILFTFLSFNVSAIQHDIEVDYVGKYASKGNSCVGEMNLYLEPKRIMIVSGKNKESFESIDHCYTCEGGVRYTGKVIWLIPEFHIVSPFRLIFFINYNEVEGDLGVEIYSTELIDKLGFSKQIFTKCSE